jgi:hypothetical protein
MSLLCHYYVIIMLLLCYYYVIIMLLLCYYYVIIMLLLCHHYAIIMLLLCYYYVIIMYYIIMHSHMTPIHNCLCLLTHPRDQHRMTFQEMSLLTSTQDGFSRNELTHIHTGWLLKK